MCGLVGIYSSNMMQKHKKVFSDLLFFDTLRGTDSTGVAAIRANSDTQILKSTIPGYEFIETPRFDQHLKFNDLCWIGHNRYGTVGKNVKSNAHPFDICDKDDLCVLVGAHNGTLRNKHVLTNDRDFGTDSEALFNEIANIGIHEAIAKVEGAWALTYYDHGLEELRFLRNKERPLCYAWEEDKKTLIWASEMWMIRVATSRNGVKLLEDKVYACVEDTLYKFPCPKKMNEEITCSREGGLVGKTFAFFQTDDKAPWGNWRNQHARHSQSSATTTAQQKATTTTQSQGTKTTDTDSQLLLTDQAQSASTTKKGKSGETQPSPKNTLSRGAQRRDELVNRVSSIQDAKRFKGHKGEAISKSELARQLDSGCVFCENEDIAITDRFAWLGFNKPVCYKCLSGGHQELEPFDNALTVH